MKKLLLVIFIASLFMTGCNKSVVNSAETSAIEVETIPPESTVTVKSETITNAKPQFEHDWQVLYYDKLIEYVDDPEVMFNIYELNGEGTPELLISEGTYHTAGGVIYTVSQGKLIRLGGYGSFGEFQYDFERNFIHSRFWQGGSEELSIHSFENGEIAQIVYFYQFEGSSYPMIKEKYVVNDEKVSKDVFNAEYERYAFDVREDFIVRKHYPIQSMIESVLNNIEF